MRMSSRRVRGRTAGLERRGGSEEVKLGIRVVRKKLVTALLGGVGYGFIRAVEKGRLRRGRIDAC